MADNLKGIPFSSDDEGVDFVTQAKNLVFEAANRDVVALRRDEIYVVWFAFVRGNWKALISTSIADGRIYEVSHKRENDGSDGPESTVVDVYVKTHNIVL